MTQLTTLTVTKKSPDERLGVGLADTKDGRGVCVVSVDPTSVLASSLAKGDIVMSVNGQLCTEGHAKLRSYCSTSGYCDARARWP